MTRDEILALALRSGFKTGILKYSDGTKKGDFAEAVGANCLANLERFAALVAAAEREECANVCEDHASDMDDDNDCDSADSARVCASLIRARSQSGGTP